MKPRNPTDSDQLQKIRVEKHKKYLEENNFLDLPEEVLFLILNDLESAKDHAAFQQIASRHNHTSKEFWFDKFKHDFKNEYQGYYSEGNFDWMKEFYRWTAWNKKISKYEKSYKDEKSGFNLVIDAMQFEMPIAFVALVLDQQLEDKTFWDRDNRFKTFGELLAQLHEIKVNKDRISITYLNSLATVIEKSKYAPRLIHVLVEQCENYNLIPVLSILISNDFKFSEQCKNIIKDPKNGQWLASSIYIKRNEMAKFLLENGMDPNAIHRDDGRSALSVAIHEKNMEGLKLLAKYQPKINKNDLFDAIQNSNRDGDILTILLKLGADIHTTLSFKNDKYISDSIHRYFMDRYLSNKKPEKNIESMLIEDELYSPLMHAVVRNKPGCVKILLEAGANPLEMVNQGDRNLIQRLFELTHPEYYSEIIHELLIGATKNYIHEKAKSDYKEKETHVKFNMFGKKVDMGVGYAAGPKAEKAVLLLKALETGDRNDIAALQGFGELKTGELGKLYGYAKQYFELVKKDNQLRF